MNASKRGGFSAARRLAPTTFDDLPSVSLQDETGQTRRFWLFDRPDAHREVTFEARSDIVHIKHVLENQVRKEQPDEKYTQLCSQEVQARKQTMTPKRTENNAKGELPTLEMMRLRVDAVIQAREQNESMAANNGALAEADATHLENALVELETEVEQPMMMAGGAKKKTRPAKKTSGGPGAGAGGGRVAKAAAKPKVIAPATPHTALSEDARSVVSPQEDISGLDDLVNAISSKLGGDMKSIRNLRPEKILCGDALGRSLQGAPGPVLS